MEKKLHRRGSVGADCKRCGRLGAGQEEEGAGGVSVGGGGRDALLHEVGHQQGRHHGQAGYAEHGGRVASVLEALADVGVVLLEDGGVAIGLLVLLITAATDHTLVTTHVLVDLSAEVLLAVSRAIQ